MFSIDLRETIIPFSLLQIVRQFKRMETGATIRILGIEKTIIHDLRSVLPKGKFKMLEVEPMDRKSPYYQLKLKKIHTFTLNPKETRHVGSQPK